MRNIGSYILSVTAASVISAVVISLIGSHGTVGSIVKMLAGIFLAITVIKPLIWYIHWDFDTIFSDYIENARIYTDLGRNEAAEEIERIIKSKVEAYILDKADDFRAHLTVDVILDKNVPPKPEKIVLKGNISPAARRQISQLIEKELGVDEENQQWN